MPFLNYRSIWSVALPAVALLFALRLEPLVAKEASYLTAYKAYQSAFESGEVATAIEQGYAAWQLAEEALGDHQTTAVLAYNYARLGSSNPEQVDSAKSAFDRAAALTAKGIGPLDAAEIAVGRAELDVLLNPEDEAAVEALSTQLGDPQAASAAATLVKAQAWRTLATAQLSIGEATDSYDSAQTAVSLAESLSPADAVLLRAALLTKAMANISRASSRRMRNALVEAISDMDRAIAMYDPQPNIREWDPELAQTVVWRESARIKYWSQLRDRKGRLSPDTVGSINLEPLLPELGEEYADCPKLSEYLQQSAPEFPNSESKERRLGAVLYGLKLSTVGIEEIVIIAEPEGSEFGPAARRSIETWTMRDGYPERCLPRETVGLVLFAVRK